MKIIEVSGCQECPYCIWDSEGDNWCKKGLTGRIQTMTYNKVNTHVETKTFPVNCPLMDMPSCEKEEE